MDRIVDHETNQDQSHPHATVGQTLYRIRWYGYDQNDDTWEPIDHIPRSQILLYHRRKRLRIPKDVDKAIDG